MELNQNLSNQDIHDPSLSGTKGLRYKDMEELENSEEYNESPLYGLTHDYRKASEYYSIISNPIENVGFVGIGDSKYDKSIVSERQLYDLNNHRGEEQSGVAQLSAGVAKGVILAGTTFLDGTIGLATGIGYGIANLADDDPTTGFVSGLWNNPFSQAMHDVNQAFEKILPNYYTNAERDQAWYKNIWSANFIGDKFIKNLGFAVGAMYGGGVASSLLKVSKIPKLIGMVTKSTKAPGMVTSAVGSFVSAVNEGRVEALNNSGEWLKAQEQLAKRMYEQSVSEINAEYERNKGKFIENKESGIFTDPAAEKQQIELDKAKKAYEETIARANMDIVKMGNLDLLLNIPILTVSNIFLFGKMYARGFTTSNRGFNAIKKNGQYVRGSAGIPGKVKTGAKGIGKASFESIEEGTQKWADITSGIYYENDVANFYKSKIDSDSEQESIDFIKAAARGINKTVNNSSTWEEAFIGFLTGALGMPSFGKANNNASDVYLGKGKSVALRGGVFGEFSESRAKAEKEDKIVKRMNEVLSNSKNLAFYQNMVRHMYYQKIMNEAAENGDAFEFKNGEFDQLFGDISAFIYAGKEDDLYAMINAAFDTSDENLEAIAAYTVSKQKDENGKEIFIGPFVDENGVPMMNTPEGKQQMIDKLSKTRETIFNTIKNYKKTMNDIDAMTGGQLSEDQLEELTWIKTHIGDWQNRAAELSSEVQGKIGNTIGVLSQLADAAKAFKDKEGTAHAELTEAYKEADEHEQQYRRTIEVLNTARAADGKAFSFALFNNPKLAEQLKDILNQTVTEEFDDKRSINDKIDDILKCVKAATSFNNKLEEYLKSTDKLNKDIKKTKESAKKEFDQKKSANLVEKLTNAKNIGEFREAFNEETDEELKLSTLQKLKEEGNKLAKDFDDLSLYYDEIQKTLNIANLSPQVRENAKKLFQNNFDNSEKLENAGDVNSVYIDPESIYDESLSIDNNNRNFQEAQYALSQVMNKVNQDNRFKERFSKPQPGGNNQAPTETTGSSQTPEVAEANSTAPDPVPAEIAVGEVTTEEVIQENKKLNDAVETQIVVEDEFSKQYYFPIIPELHIEAAKEGKFVPFDSETKEREGLDFSIIYQYLKNHHAFEYVNEGNLKQGDVIGFMIDPKFEEEMKASLKGYKGPTIFLVDKKNNQIVGSLAESANVTKRYTGLLALRDKIVEEYKKSGNTLDKFNSQLSTKVSKMMVGKVPISKEERSLSTLFNKGSGNKPIFGIIKNGILDTNGKLSDSQITKPKDISNKEGRLYLLIPNGAGKYSPMLIKTKHFNRESFDIESIEFENIPIIKSINSIIEKLIDAKEEGLFNSALGDLKSNLFIRKGIHINQFSSANGSGIVINEAILDNHGNEQYEEKEVDGKKVRIRKEKKPIYIYTINFQREPNVIKRIGASEDFEVRDAKEVKKEFLNALLDLDLPFQVNVGMINRPGYNERLVNSNVLYSNITDARVLSNWFIIDYYDSESGTFKSADSPENIGDISKSNTTIEGTAITLNGNTYYINLNTRNIKNSKNEDAKLPDSEKELLLDLAWAQSLHGSKKEASNMYDNKIITPSGKVLDRTTQRYLSGQEAEKIKAIINGESINPTNKEIENKILSIIEKIKNHFLGRINDKFEIIEEDGQKHKYDSVNDILGTNFKETDKQKEVLNKVRIKLSELADNSEKYNEYIHSLEKYWKIDLSNYLGKINIEDRNNVIEEIHRVILNTTNNYTKEFIKNTILNYFYDGKIPNRPYKISEEAFKSLIESFVEFKDAVEANGERILKSYTPLSHKFSDDVRIADEADIITVDKQGNFKIYKIAVGTTSFHNFTNKSGKTVNYFVNKSSTQLMSEKDYITKQLSAQKELFEAEYEGKVTTLAIIPIVTSIENGVAKTFIREKGIKIDYTPVLNAPTKTISTTNESVISNNNQGSNILSIFNTSLELQNPINSVLPLYGFDKNDKIGYFIIDDKLHKGYLKSLGKINNIDVHLTRVPNMTKGFGKNPDHAASYNYYVVFPNGNSMMISNNIPVSNTDVIEKITKALNNNPTRIVEESNKETLISKFITSQKPVSSAAKSATKLNSIRRDGPKFRVEDSTKRSVWNQEKELKWLERVLPQLTKEQRVKVIKGLIKAGSNGEVAWGMFNRGIITLSDMAAAGTTYHEAFHVVFNILLDPQEQQELFGEARQMYDLENKKSLEELEEALAEGFREYTMTRERKGLLNKIKLFFQNLWNIVTGHKRMYPHLTSLYQRINEGKYADRNLNTSNITRSFKEQYTEETQTIKNQAIDNGTFMKAPNGQPTKLTERQWLQVRTKAFKEWFGDWENDPENASKVVDENGEPLVVYHTNRRGSVTGPITIFSRDNKRYGDKYLYYFSSDKGTAKSYEMSPIDRDWVYDRNLSTKDLKQVLGINSTLAKHISKLKSFEEILTYLKRELENRKSIKNNSKSKFKPLSKIDLNTGERTDFQDNTKPRFDLEIQGYVYSDGTITYEKPLELVSDSYYEDAIQLIEEHINFINSNAKNSAEYKTNAVFLNLRTPKEFNAKGKNWSDYGKYFQRLGRYQDVEDYYNSNKTNNNDGFIVSNYMDMSYEKDERNILSTTYAVENSNQIKSATDNISTFDPNNDDIRYRIAENLIQNKKSIKDKLIQSFESLSDETKSDLNAKGWTEQEFNSLSQREKQQAIKCS